MYAQDPDENFGLPFWIGKIHDLRPPIEENDSDSDEVNKEDVKGCCVRSIVVSEAVRLLGVSEAARAAVSTVLCRCCAVPCQR